LRPAARGEVSACLSAIKIGTVHDEFVRLAAIELTELTKFEGGYWRNKKKRMAKERKGCPSVGRKSLGTVL